LEFGFSWWWGREVCAVDSGELWPPLLEVALPRLWMLLPGMGLGREKKVEVGEMGLWVWPL
jgi:hypothetical protein